MERRRRMISPVIVLASLLLCLGVMALTGGQVDAQEPKVVVVGDWEDLEREVKKDDESAADIIELANNIEIEATLRVLRTVTIRTQENENNTFIISRANAFYVKMFEVDVEEPPGASTKQGKLTLSNIILDGGSTGEKTAAMGSLIQVSKNAELNLEKGATLKNNRLTGKDDGGAVYLYGKMTMGEGSIITNNSTGGSGGGICVNRGASLIVSGGEISMNTALYGGGIYTDHADIYDPNRSEEEEDQFAEISLKDATISKNKASYSNSSDSETTIGLGGGLYIGNRTVVSAFSRMTIEENSAGDPGEQSNGHNGNGGGIYLDARDNAKSIYTEITVESSTISGNKVYSPNATPANTGLGGGIYCGGGSLTLDKSIIKDNSTARYGGGLFAGLPGEVTIKNGSITGNTVGTEDNDLYLTGGGAKTGKMEVVLSGEPVIGYATSENWNSYNLRIDDAGLATDAAIGLDGDSNTITPNETAFVTNLKKGEERYFSQEFANPVGRLTVMNNLSDKGEPLYGEWDHSLVLLSGDLPNYLLSYGKVNWAAPEDLTFNMNEAFADSTMIKASFSNPDNSETASIAAEDRAYTANTGTVVIPKDKQTNYQNNPLTTGAGREIDVVMGIPEVSPKYYVNLKGTFSAENEVYTIAPQPIEYTDYYNDVSGTIKTYKANAERIGNTVSVDGKTLEAGNDYTLLWNDQTKDVQLTFKKAWLWEQPLDEYDIVVTFADDTTTYGTATGKIKIDFSGPWNEDEYNLTQYIEKLELYAGVPDFLVRAKSLTATVDVVNQHFDKVPVVINQGGEHNEIICTLDAGILSQIPKGENDMVVTITTEGGLIGRYQSKLVGKWGEFTVTSPFTDLTNDHPKTSATIETYADNARRMTVKVGETVLDKADYNTEGSQEGAVKINFDAASEAIKALPNGIQRVSIIFGANGEFGTAKAQLTKLITETPVITITPQGIILNVKQGETDRLTGTAASSDGKTPTISATQPDGSALPTGFTFADSDGNYTLTVGETAEIGTTIVRVTAVHPEDAAISDTRDLTVNITKDALPIITITPEANELKLTRGETGELKGSAVSDDNKTPIITAALAKGSVLPTGFTLTSENGSYTLTVGGDAAVGEYTIVITATHPTISEAQATQDLRVSITEAPKTIAFEESEYALTGYKSSLVMGVTGDAEIIHSGSTFTLTIDDKTLVDPTEYSAVVENGRLALTLKEALLNSLVNKDYTVELTAENTGGETASATTTLVVNRRFDPVKPVPDVTDPTKPVVIVIDDLGHLNVEDMVVNFDGKELVKDRDYFVNEEKGEISITFAEEFIEGLTNKTIDGYDILITFEKEGEEYGRTETELIVNIPPKVNFDLNAPLPIQKDAITEFNRDFGDYISLNLNGAPVPQFILPSGEYQLSENEIELGEVYASSTVVKLYAGYLETLPNGEYALEVFFREGGAQASETIVFTINREAPKPSPTPKILSGRVTSTGDTENTMLWALLAAVAAIGLAGTIVWRKKQEK